MRSKFDEQLSVLNQEMIKMGIMIEESIAKAIDALVNQDVDAAKCIMEKDNDIDQEQKRIEGLCFNLLIQQQPVARDLRVITAAMKMVTDMERIGDHASDISEITLLMAKEHVKMNLEDINKMASETMLMLHLSIEAYVEKDIQKAKAVIERDDIVDDLFIKAKKDIIQMVLKAPNDGEHATDLLMIAKYFERIGDHATNISERVIYSLE